MKYWYANVIARKRTNMPHWHVPNGIYFVTFRLADSLPRYVEERLAEMRKALRSAREDRHDGVEARRVERAIFKVTEDDLDIHRGKCWLRNSEVAVMVQSALDYGDGNAYEMVAMALMPNHVHVVFRLADAELDAVIKQWKSFTSHRANKMLGRSGRFWQADYFDVLMRDSEQLQRTVTYVLNNPAKAGLENWPYTRSWPERIALMI